MDDFIAPRRYKPTSSNIPAYSLEQGNSSILESQSSSTSSSALLAPNYPSRRRTTSFFPVIDPLHSAPTVASSGLTASVSSNDISLYTPLQAQQPLRPRISTPSRIPTPSFESKTLVHLHATSSPKPFSMFKEVRVEVTPTCNDADMLTQNLPPPHRLLGPLPPGRPLGLPKSRTMNMLSTITSSFSRSNLNLLSRQSLSNLSELATTGDSQMYPTLTTNISQVMTRMPESYWLGRYVALFDLFHEDTLGMSSIEGLRLCIDMTESETESMKEQYLNDEEIRSINVFQHLETICMTNEARLSMQSFQQAFARKVQCEALLPKGGSMIDKKNMFARAGRLLSGGRKQISVAPGRRSSGLSTESSF